MFKDQIIKRIKNQKNINEDKIQSLLQLGLIFNLENTTEVIVHRGSKIGGLPPVLEQPYPSIGEEPLTFLAELSLPQICHLNNILPKRGQLYFFILTSDIGYRYPEGKTEFRVIYEKGGHLENEEMKVQTVPEHIIKFFEQYTFPSFQENIIIKNNLTHEESYFIEELEFELQLSTESVIDIGHQVLGHPKAIQGTVRFWWAAKYLGIKNIDAISQKEAQRIKNEEDKFFLLLQLDFSDEKIGIERFGGSVAYFGIHENDLRDCNFDNAILVMQNT